jgi:uncharacterized membrane protein
MTERVHTQPMRSAVRGPPIHPPFTHFPIALWTMSFVFDLLSIWMGNAMVRAAFYNLAAGTALAILTGAAGVLDYSKIPSGDAARRPGIVHAVLMVSVIVVFMVDTWFQSQLLTADHVTFIAVALTGAGLCALVIGTYLGHRLVFDYGANVVRLAEPRSATTVSRGTESGPRPIRP